MNASRLDRLRTMTAGELAFRANAAARIQAGRLAAAARPPRWNRSALKRALAAHVLDREIAGAIGRDEWTGVERSLRRAISSRRSAFVIDHATAADVREEILRRWPSAAREAREGADRIVRGEYDLLGYRSLRIATGDTAIDWHLDPVSGLRAPKVFWASVPYLDPAVGDHKVIWELNRHQHWLSLGRALWLTGDAVYGREMVAQLRSWLAANPPLTGINWASMLELALRSLSWVSAIHLLLARQDEAAGSARWHPEKEDDAPWLIDMLIGLDRQLRHVASNLSTYFSPNTHLIGEALALYVVGHSIPELRHSPRWIDIGRRVLLDQVRAQVEPDGGHAERSFHYHRYTLDFYLLALIVAERCGDDGAAAVFRDGVDRMATFLRAVADDRGMLPLVGDDDGGLLWPFAGRHPADARDSLALAAVVLARPELAPWGACEETVWLAWSEYRDRIRRPLERHVPGEARPGLMTFPHTGYVVARGADGDHLVFDAGPHGYLNCGHAHADALAVTLALTGRPLLIDPGTGGYTATPELRDRMRRTANHNTLCVGGRSSSIPAGPFHWRSRANGRLHAGVGHPAFAWVEGSHDGYAPLRHRRSIVLADGGWLFVDELVEAALEMESAPSMSGRELLPRFARPDEGGQRVRGSRLVRHDGLIGGGGAEAQVHWHFDPAWEVTSTSSTTLLARTRDGEAAWIVQDAGAFSLARGDEASGLGWCSPRYGVVMPTWSARASRSGPTPLTMMTWIGGTPSGTAPALERLAVPRHAGGCTIVAARLRRGRSVETVILTPGGVDSAGRWDAGGCRADARMVHRTVNQGRLESLSAAGCGYVVIGDGDLSMVSDHAIDVHLRMTDGRVAIHAAGPPPQLRLDGAAIEGVREVWLNGRRIVRDGSGALAFSRADWPAGAAPGGDLCVA